MIRDSAYPPCGEVVERLIALYDRPFGGKQRGRYRISMKLMCRFFGQRRIWPEQIEAVRRGLYERGYLLADMETYFAVVSQATFVNYRRANQASVEMTCDTAEPGAAPVLESTSSE